MMSPSRIRTTSPGTRQAGARGWRPRALTGQGYEGHRFWDSEIFLVPVLAYTSPRQARDLLMFRHATLPAARARARQLGLGGALFPWRTITGPMFPRTSRPAPPATR